MFPEQWKWSEMHEMCPKYLCTSTQGNNSKPRIKVYCNRECFVLATVLHKKQILVHCCSSELCNKASSYEQEKKMAAVECIIELVFQYSNFPKMSLGQKLYLMHLFHTKLIIFVHTGRFTTLGHNCRRWFPRFLWSKIRINMCPILDCYGVMGIF